MSVFWEFLGRAGPIMAGGGAVQLIIWFLKRRGENRKITVDADSTVVASAGASVIIASQLRDQAIARVSALEGQVTLLQEQVTQLAAQVLAERRLIAAAAVREATLNNEIAILKGSP